MLNKYIVECSYRLKIVERIFFGENMHFLEINADDFDKRKLKTNDTIGAVV